MVDGDVHIDRVPEHDDIDDQAERSELILLAFAIALAQFAALSMKDDAGELVAAFAAIELDEDTASVAFIVDESQEVERFDEPPEFLQGAGQARRSIVGLECPVEAGRVDDAELQGNSVM